MAFRTHLYSPEQAPLCALSFVTPFAMEDSIFRFQGLGHRHIFGLTIQLINGNYVRFPY